MFPTKVLLATDGSAGAERAARMAATLSESLDCALHVVYVEGHLGDRLGDRSFGTAEVSLHVDDGSVRREELDEARLVHPVRVELAGEERHQVDHVDHADLEFRCVLA